MKHIRCRTWSVLPPELLEEIYKRLPMSDRIRFASICKDWLSIAAAKPRPPPPVPESWLMYPGTSEFLSLSLERAYRFNNVIPPKELKIVGASNGWVLTQHSEHNGLLILVNPISNINIILPRVDEHTRIKCVKKVIVATFGDSVLPAGVFIFTHLDSLLVCCCDTGPWMTFYQTLNDVLFYNGEIYTLVIQESKTIVTAYNLNEQLEPLLQHRYVFDDSVPEDLESCLVESGGDLLLVERQYSQRQHTTGFEVFNLLLEEEDSSVHLVRLQSLGDQVLCWGRDGCISVPAAGNYSLFEEDHIYYINILCEIGVYSLIEERIKRFYQTPRKFFRQEPIWFVPRFKDTIVDMNKINLN